MKIPTIKEKKILKQISIKAKDMLYLEKQSMLACRTFSDELGEVIAFYRKYWRLEARYKKLYEDQEEQRPMPAGTTENLKEI